MNFRTFGSIAGSILFLTACASNLPSSPAGAPIVTQSRRAASPLAVPRRALGCYGTFAVKVKPCPAKLTKKNGGTVSVAVSGPGVAIAVVIASDCVGSGSVCNIVQTGYTQFEASSVVGQNPCGTGYVVFEGLTASLSPVGTATLKVINKYC
jgi:hypothetical protein